MKDITITIIYKNNKSMPTRNYPIFLFFGMWKVEIMELYKN